MSLHVWISWAPPTSRRGEPEAGLSALKRGAPHLFPAAQIPAVELIKSEGRTESPLTSGQCPLFRNSKHTGTVFAYTYTCTYVNFVCQKHKGHLFHKGQVIYIFDKDINTCLVEVVRKTSCLLM